MPSLSPFLLVSPKGNFDVIDLMLARGANINATSKHGWTPLMLAAKRGTQHVFLTYSHKVQM